MLGNLKDVQQDLISKPWVLMDRPVLDPLKLAEAVRVKVKEREDMLNICQSSLVRKMQGRTGEIIERPGWRVANDAEVRGGCIATDCPEVAPFVCSVEACKAYCCSTHGPDHHLHVSWATNEALVVQRDQRKAAAAITNPVVRSRGGRSRGGRAGRGGRGGRGGGEGQMAGGSNAIELRVEGQSTPSEVENESSRGGRASRGRGRGRGGRSYPQQISSANAATDISEAIPPEEVNPLAILAGLLRSHPNLLSQIASMNDDSTETILDEWIL